MKISEYIKALEDIKTEHGDLEVETETHYGRDSKKPPEIAYRRILGPRERRPEFWNRFYRAEGTKGEKVVRV